MKDKLSSNSLSVNDCNAFHCQADDQKCDYSITPYCEPEEVEVINLIKNSTTASSDLDPIPAWIIKRCNKAIPKIMTDIVNLSL